MKQWNNNELDRLLDQGLSEYSNATPRVGLEARVLATLATDSTTPKRWWLWAAVPVCAAILAAAILWAWRSPNTIGLPQIATIPAPEVVKTPAMRRLDVPVTAVNRRLTHGQSRVFAVTAPRLPTFPSQNNEGQAHLALRFVQRNPDLANQVVKEEQEFQEMASREFDATNLQRDRSERK